MYFYVPESNMYLIDHTSYNQLIWSVIIKIWDTGPNSTFLQLVWSDLNHVRCM